MPRRVTLPGAAELFRPTQPAPADPASADPAPGAAAAPGRIAAGADGLDQGGSGRVRHDEKITVYVSTAELIALEEARLMLRSRHGVAVDRGRIVRAAIAALLADLGASGDDSELVRRLSST